MSSENRGTNPDENTDLAELLTRALEAKEEGIEPDIDLLCAERPDLRDALRDALEQNPKVTSLHEALVGRDPFLGRALGSRYRLDARLGAGAMGVVYRAHDLELQRPVAIKILRDDLLSGTDLDRRFEREAEVLAAIDHPAVVKVFDRGTAESGERYLVMEILEGQPLNRLLEDAIEGAGEERTPLTDLRTIARWGAELASGLAAAHARGIVHRDVKPSNVFLRDDRRPVLLDFGLAARQAQETLTREGSTLGTPAYMAPEALRSEAKPGPTGDVYGLAATLYHLVGGRAPYRGTPSQIFVELLTRDPQPIHKLRPALPRDLRAIIEKGMARRVADRYPTADALAADLRAFLEYEPVQARPIGPVKRVWRRARRSTAVRAGAAVLLLVAFVAGSRLLHSSWKDRRFGELNELWRRLPPGLTIHNPENRVLSEQEGRAEVRALLDRAAELCDDPLPTLAVHAAFLLDHGEHEEAARSMSRVGREVGTKYARALAERYSDADRGTDGAGAVNLAGLPAPETAADLYLAGLHAYRVGENELAEEHLKDPRAAGYLPAMELGAVFEWPAAKLLERALWVEQQRGVRTAWMAQLACAALLTQKHYTDAYEVVEEGLELAPKSYTLLENAGWLAFRLDEVERAREHYRECVELKPQNLKGHKWRVVVLLYAGLLEEAAEAIAEIPQDAAPAAALALALSGELETERALRQWAAGEQAASEESATLACELFEEAVALGREIDSDRHAVARALAVGDADGIFRSLLEQFSGDDIRERHLLRLAEFMPPDLDEDDTAALRKYLEGAAISLGRGRGPKPDPRPDSNN